MALAEPPALPERPPISAPERGDRSSGGAEVRRRGMQQPRLGLIGLPTLVVPIAAVLAVGAGGPDGSVLVLTPLVTYALPLVAMVAFWWEDWPGTRLRPSWSGWADTALIAVGAVVLTGVGQIAAGVALLAAADGIEFTRASPDEWVEHVGLNALGVSIILHVAVGRRWPFARVS